MARRPALKIIPILLAVDAVAVRGGAISNAQSALANPAVIPQAIGNVVRNIAADPIAVAELVASFLLAPGMYKQSMHIGGRKLKWL